MSDNEDTPQALQNTARQTVVVNDEHGWSGEPVEITYRPASWYTRNKALQEAKDRYYREHKDDPEGGIGADYVEAVKQLAVNMIQDWSLDSNVGLAWDNLHPDLGDAILTAMNVDDMFMVSERDEEEYNEEVRQAKNSS